MESPQNSRHKSLSLFIKNSLYSHGSAVIDKRHIDIDCTEGKTKTKTTISVIVSSLPANLSNVQHISTSHMNMIGR